MPFTSGYNAAKKNRKNKPNKSNNPQISIRRIMVKSFTIDARFDVFTLKSRIYREFFDQIAHPQIGLYSY